MRVIQAEQITQVVARLCIQANTCLPVDVVNCLKNCYRQESWSPAQNVLGTIIENAAFGADSGTPVCQDTGMACVFLEIGDQVHIQGNVSMAVDEGVRQGYCDGYLRKSVVRDPLDRINTGDNTPAMIYYEPTHGDQVRITVAPKGFGSENMSRLKMLRPSDGIQGIVRFVLETVELAGSNPCSPIVVGVGLGGTFDKAAYLAKRALLRDLGSSHPDPKYQDLEKELLGQINNLGIGPAGLGGATTALAVHIEAMPTHIAGLPCAVNINCHVARHATEVL